MQDPQSVNANFDFHNPYKPDGANIATCLTAVKGKRPRVSKSLQKQLGRNQFVASVCICAEQTFTEASAQNRAFGPAFSAALNAYLGSPLEDNVNKEITHSVPDFYCDQMAQQMAELILLHRHRTSRHQRDSPDDAQWPHRRGRGFSSLFRHLKSS
ncbi:hypothetical protein C8J57DRAFT_1389608 [Mycena rebaudengoi]|nr:hypothetical protein C8J57DRAFT_1389608 [Mycena rebaudengoi]